MAVKRWDIDMIDKDIIFSVPLKEWILIAKSQITNDLETVETSDKNYGIHF